jgi:micrococcal nuclease
MKYVSARRAVRIAGIFVFLGVIFLAAARLGDQNTAGGSTAGGSGLSEVLYVTDGDTIHVRIEGKEEKVRLLGINAPETAKPDLHQEGQCYADEAKVRLKELVGGKKVTMSLDSRSSNRDKYGRLLRYLFVEGEQTSVNETLVREGFARHYTAARLASYKQYAGYEEDAKKQNVGLWKNCPAP